MTIRYHASSYLVENAAIIGVEAAIIKEKTFLYCSGLATIHFYTTVIAFPRSIEECFDIQSHTSLEAVHW
jgi:hypothetical protein